MKFHYPDGGPLHPTFWRNTGDSNEFAPDGTVVAPGENHQTDGALKLRDYYLAHAPAQPPRSFEPTMPTQRPQANYKLPDGRITYEWDVAREARKSGEPPVANSVEIARWDRSYAMEQLLQWPGYWADEQLRRRGEWYMAHMRRQQAEQAQGERDGD